jgi:hypothetical protein
MRANEIGFIDYTQFPGASADERTARIGNDSIARATRILVLLIFLGLISFAAVQSSRLDHSKCGAFTIGESAVGGCDWIGR